MTYIKHPEHGNRHVSADEADKLVADGWVIWPRNKEAKAGIVSQEIVTADGNGEVLIGQIIATAEAPRRGRPRSLPKAT